MFSIQILTKWLVRASHVLSSSHSRCKELSLQMKSQKWLDQIRPGELSTKELSSKTMTAYRGPWYSRRLSKTETATSRGSTSGSPSTTSRRSRLFHKSTWTSQTSLLNTRLKASTSRLALKLRKLTRTAIPNGFKYLFTWNTSYVRRLLSIRSSGTTWMDAKWQSRTLAVKSSSWSCQSYKILPSKTSMLDFNQSQADWPKFKNQILMTSPFTWFLIWTNAIWFAVHNLSMVELMVPEYLFWTTRRRRAQSRIPKFLSWLTKATKSTRMRLTGNTLPSSPIPSSLQPCSPTRSSTARRRRKSLKTQWRQFWIAWSSTLQWRCHGSWSEQISNKNSWSKLTLEGALKSSNGSAS